MSVLGRVLAGALSVVCLVGCEKKSAPAAPVPSTGLPPLGDDVAAAPPTDHPEHPPTGATGMPGLPPGHMALPPGHAAMPPGHPPMGDNIDPEAKTPGDVPFDPKSVVSGVLRLDDKLKSKVAEGDTIFLVARAAAEPGVPGPVLAVKKLTATKWPMPFQLDSRDAMMAGTQMHGKVVVTVRVDKDGDAMTKNPGDVVGTSRPVAVPSEKILITLDSVL